MLIVTEIKKAITAKDIVFLQDNTCAFFRNGECVAASCKGEDACDCTNEEDVLTCAEYFLRFAEKREFGEYYTPDFDKIIRRKKVSVAALTGADEIGLVCDACYASNKCPQYQQSSTCSIEWGLEEHELTPEKIMAKLLSIQTQRVNRGVMQEVFDGGVTDANTSGEIDRLERLADRMRSFQEVTTTIQHTQTAQTTITTNSNEGGGILARLFGGSNATPPAETPKELAQVTEDASIEIVPETEKIAVKRNKVKKD
jgi:hypothetical protein